MKLEEFHAEVAREYQSHMGEANPWRLGQSYFNVLSELRPDLSEQLRGTKLDPFHIDSVLPLFNVWLLDHWNEGQVMPAA